MINKFQEGGQLEQILTMVAQFLLQNGQAQDEQTAMQSAQQLVQAAQSGNQEAQAALQQIMQATPSARLGAKLAYIKKLRGECPEGEELVYFKAGGRICKACQGKQMSKGGEVKKKAKISVKPCKEAKGGILANKGTAFGDGTKGANPRNTDHGGHKSHGNTKAASYMKKTNIPNKFTAFGDTGKYKPTNVGLVGHKATGKTGRMQSKQTVSDNVNKHTAFGSHINKTHRGAKATAVGGWKSIKGAPKGHPKDMGWKKYANGGTLTEQFAKLIQK